MRTKAVVRFNSTCRFRRSQLLFFLFCFVDKVVEPLFKFFGAYLCGLDVGYPDGYLIGASIDCHDCDFEWPDDLISEVEEDDDYSFAYSCYKSLL